MTSQTIRITPHVSEKAYDSSEKGVYVFKVPSDANKHSVAQAVKSQYKVTVENVRTVLVKGKPKKTAKRRQRPTLGRRSDFKKAYITLKKGDRINVFPEAE